MLQHFSTNNYYLNRIKSKKRYKMEKSFFESKTVQGIILAAVGFLWGIWTGENTISQSVVVAGLGWAGYGFRDAQP